MRKFIILLVLILASLQGVRAQQDAQYTQYMYNTMVINPAYAGSRGAMSIVGLHRSQWVGLDGAPKTQTLSINSPVSKQVGLGLSIVNDQIGNGTSQETSFDAAFSYTIRVSEQGNLSFGLNAGGRLLNIDFNKLKNYDANSSTIGAPNIDRKFSPNFGAGIYYHTNKFYLGLSVPSFLETEHFDNTDNNSSYLAIERMNWYLISGYVFQVSPDVKLKPAMLFKAVKGAPLQVDLSATALFYEKFNLGVAYRWDAAFSALVGFQISEQFLLGLAYDKETTRLGNTAFNDGSFEFLLRYELKRKHKKIFSPRFF